MADKKPPITLRDITRFLKKKKKDSKSVAKQVGKGIKKDWDSLMRGLGK